MWATLALVCCGGLTFFAAVRRPIFSQAYREYALCAVATRVSGAASEAIVSTRLIVEFVHGQLDPESGPLRDVTPWETLVRGVGACDQAAVVAAHLLAERGVRARPVVLRRADGISPHTALEVELSDRWTLWDPHFGIEFSERGAPLTLSQLVVSPERMETATFLSARTPEDRAVVLEFYRRVLVGAREATRWKSPLDEMRPRDRMIRVLAAWCGKRGGRAIPRLLQRTFLSLVPDACGVADACSDAAAEGLAPDVKLWNRARNRDLFGDSEGAVAEYSELLHRHEDSPYAFRARFRRGVLLLGLRREAAGRDDLLAILAESRAEPLWARAHLLLRLPGPPPADARIRALRRQ